jgi:hypothetical protein
MSESTKNLLDAVVDIFRQVLRQELQAQFAVMNKNKGDLYEKDWLKASEAAELYSLPRTWFEERGRAGDIERSKPGRYVLFNRRDIERYLERHRRKKSLTSAAGSSTKCRYHDQRRAEAGQGAPQDDAEGVGRGVGDANQQHLQAGGGDAEDQETH